MLVHCYRLQTPHLLLLQRTTEKTYLSIDHVKMIFQTIFTVALVTAASIANAYVIERQTQGAQFYNNTVVCGQAVFGGCCAGTLDEYGNNASCESSTGVYTKCKD